MHARIVTVQIQPGKIDELIRIFRDSIVPAAKQQKGFKRSFLLTDKKTGKGISVALWETEADMEKSEATGYQREQIGKVASLFSAPPTTEYYEVSAQS
jgi:heme-degrading monooxygenase HmoA